MVNSITAAEPVGYDGHAPNEAKTAMGWTDGGLQGGL